MAVGYFTNYFMTAVETHKHRTYEHPYVVETDKSKTMGRLNRIFHILSFLCAFSSLVLFMVGMFAASDKVTHLLVK
jgi:hypothetical protein